MDIVEEIEFETDRPYTGLATKTFVDVFGDDSSFSVCRLFDLSMMSDRF